MERHHAQDLARIGPTGMIFVPSAKGISHSPRELLPQTVLRLDAR